MKIVIIGGTGLIGSKLGSVLSSRGHEVVVASPSTGVNSITGEGLPEALGGAQVVVDVANSPSFEDKAVLEFFETSGRNLLAAEQAAGVGHHVALSVVGTERLQGSGYFRGKMAQEKLIKHAARPQWPASRRGIGQYRSWHPDLRAPGEERRCRTDREPDADAGIALASTCLGAAIRERREASWVDVLDGWIGPRNCSEPVQSM
jgi:hypothetical protein